MGYKLAKVIVILIILSIPTFAISCKKAGTNDLSKANAFEHKSTWKANVDENTNQLRKIYKKARDLENAKDYKTAYDLYNALDPSYGALIDFVLFHRAEVAKQIPDEASVIKDLKTIIEKYPDSPIVDLATYSLGQSYVRIKDDENAKKYFEQTIKQFPKTNYAIASEYYLGELCAKQPKELQQAIKYFAAYLKEAPDGSFSVNSAEALIKLVGTDKLTDEENQLIGLAYYHGGYYSSAINFLKNDFNESTWYALGKSYQITGQTQLAIDTFSRALNTFSKINPEEVDNAFKATALIKGNDVEAWEYCEKIFPNYADIGLYFKAQKVYDYQGKNLYKEIVTRFPNSRYAPEASWVVFWDLFNSGHYKEAIEHGRNHLKAYPTAQSSPRIVYWVGKAYERLAQKNNAITVYERLISHFPNNYYSYRADERLNELKYKKSDNLWKTIPAGYHYNSDWSPPLPIPYEEIANTFGDKLAELMYLDDIESANYILRKDLDPRIESYFQLRQGLKSKSIVVLRDKQQDFLKTLPGDEKAWELLYPLHFSDLIKINATKYTLDPLLVQALTREESYFNPQAISSSSAKGLMQLIPSTAQAVANWEKLPGFSQFDLFKPEINIRLGTRYLKYTHEKFAGNSMLAVAAYNGGPGNVSRWLGSISTDDWDQFVENIPLTETRNYVKKVFTSYWSYREIYVYKAT